MYSLTHKLKVLAISIALAAGSVVLTPATAFALPNGACSVGAFSGGDGSNDFPYQVATAEALAEVADCGGNGWSYIQTADINLSGTWSNSQTFSGTYDGDSHTISGLYIDGSNGYGSRGLFSEMDDAYVGDLTIEGEIVNAISSSGLLAGSAYTSTFSTVQVVVNGISVDSQRSSATYHVGGLVGQMSEDSSAGAITVLTNTNAVIEADDTVGGIVGIAIDSSVYNSSALVDVFAIGNETFATHSGYAGGIAGYTYLSGNPDYEGRTFWLSYVTASGNVFCDTVAKDCGGIVGASLFPIRNSSASGNVSGGQRIGGLAGYTRTSVSDSFATGDVTAEAGYAGGLIGYMYLFAEEVEVVRSFSYGSVTAASYSGGLIGTIGLADSPSFELSNSYATGNVQGNNSAGLIADVLGNNLNSVAVSNNYFSGILPVGSDAITGANIGSTVDFTFSNNLWNKGENAITSQRADASYGVRKTLLARVTTFSDPSWDLESIWKLDRDFQSGYLSLRGVGTMEINANPVPTCSKRSLKPVSFKKNSAKLTNATREILRQDALKIINSWCSTIEINGYASKNDAKKKQKTLAKNRTTVVRNFINRQLEQNWIYLVVTGTSKGLISKGKPAMNQKASIKIIN